MKFKMIHENYNVSDLEQSIKFYNEALDLHEVGRKTTDDFIKDPDGYWLEICSHFSFS